MSRKWRLPSVVVALVFIPSLVPMPTSCAAEKIPIIYSTDLFQPHDDPDDHFDLATLFALDEFDVLGIIVEHGAKQANSPGRIPVEQMLHLSGRQVPFAVGLNPPMKSLDDQMLDQADEFQQGVELILTALRKSDRKVTIFTTGSMCDVAVAFNREPDLFRRKVARLYMNIGNASGKESEYNVGLDVNAYMRILKSDLPVYWCPCFGSPYGTYWKFRQSDVLETAPPGLQNFFIFALTAGRQWKATPAPATDDPVGLLARKVDPAARQEVWRLDRNMWCTAPFFHAAGRRIVEVSPNQYAASPAGEADGNEVKLFDFVSGRISIDDRGLTSFQEVGPPHEPGALRTFKVLDSGRYEKVMTSCLRELFRGARFGGH